MARQQPLKLSDLPSNVEHPLGSSLLEGKCVIHVKLTDTCMKSIEALIHSDKGAFFSLWFEENGGTMMIPMSSGEPRSFAFKSASLHGGEGHSSLECIHQVLDHRQHKFVCLDPIKHRLTVQATEDVYDRTRNLMIKAEAERKEARAQEIKLPSSNSRKSKSSVISMGPAVAQPMARKIVRPPMKPVKDFAPKPSPPKLVPQLTSGRSPKSLRDRIIHLLALKPHKRSDIVARLKRDTKRSESAMSNLDSILNEVSDIHLGVYNLKPSHLADLQVDDWPFYSESEKQLVRRRTHVKHGAAAAMEGGVDTGQPAKRPLSGSITKPSDTKKPKLSHAPTLSQDHSLTPPTSIYHKIPNHHSLPPSHKSSPGPPHPTSTLAPPASFPPPVGKPSLSSVHPQSQSGTQPQSGVHSLHSSHRPASTSASNATLSMPTFVGMARPDSPAVPVTNGSMSGLGLVALPGPRNGPSEPVLAASVAALGSSLSDRTDVEIKEPRKKKRKKEKTKKRKEKEELLEKGVSKLKQELQPSSPAEQAAMHNHPGVSQELQPAEQAAKHNRPGVSKLNQEPQPSSPADQASIHHYPGVSKFLKEPQPSSPAEQAAPSYPSSTSSIPDFFIEFPPITSDTVRMAYKETFNTTYPEYLQCKATTDSLQGEQARLSQQLQSVPADSEAAKDIWRKIHETYEKKHRFEELHHRLAHIKMMVVEYDAARASQ